jgi:putative ABC transport system permease protein
VALLKNTMRTSLTVLGITIGIAAVIFVVGIGKTGQLRVEQQLNKLGDNFIWIEAGGRAVNGVRNVSLSFAMEKPARMDRFWTEQSHVYTERSA